MFLILIKMIYYYVKKKQFIKETNSEDFRISFSFMFYI